MTELQPKIEEIRKKFPDDRQKQSLEMMALYKRENVNLFSSCLPNLIQLPILICLYYAFRNGLDPARQVLIYDFMPKPEFIDRTFFGLDLTVPDSTYILPLIAGLLQFFQTKMMTPKVTQGNKNDPSVMMQRNMVYMFPVLTVFISRSFAAALPLYWIVTSLFSIVQQRLIIKKRQKEIKAVQASSENREADSDSNDKGELKAISPSKENKKGVELIVRQKN